MSLEGKTIAWVEGYGDLLVFTDGTGLRISSDDDRHYLDDLSYADVRAHQHRAQGAREQERMRRLEDTLHPRDQEWLAEQRLEARRRQMEKMGPFERAVVQEIESMWLPINSDFSRFAFGDGLINSPPKKRKARRS